MKTEFETATTDLARRVPPHSVEAERAVLAGLILRPSAMGQIAPMLHPEDFYLPAHQTLYAAALGLHTDNRPVDLVTLAEHLRDQGSLEQAGGAAYIADLAQSHVSAANAEYYAKLVRDKSIQRGLIEAGAKIVSTGFDTSKDLAGLQSELQTGRLSSKRHTSNYFTVFTRTSDPILTSSRNRPYQSAPSIDRFRDVPLSGTGSFGIQRVPANGNQLPPRNRIGIDLDHLAESARFVLMRFIDHTDHSRFAQCERALGVAHLQARAGSLRPYYY